MNNSNDSTNNNSNIGNNDNLMNSGNNGISNDGNTLFNNNDVMNINNNTSNSNNLISNNGNNIFPNNNDLLSNNGNSMNNNNFVNSNNNTTIYNNDVTSNGGYTVLNNNVASNSAYENYNMNNGNNNKSNVFAILGFVFAIFVFIFALLTSILGLIFSIIGLKKSKELGTGRGLSIAGIIISFIRLFLMLVYIIFAFVFATSNVSNTVDRAKEVTVQTASNGIAEWIERQNQLSKIDYDSLSDSYKSYIESHDIGSSVQPLIRDIVLYAGYENNDTYTIDYNNSTVKLNNDKACVKLSVKIDNKKIEKYSSGCNQS